MSDEIQNCPTDLHNLELFIEAKDTKLQFNNQRAKCVFSLSAGVLLRLNLSSIKLWITALSYIYIYI
jgi:hypothetical protein